MSVPTHTPQPPLGPDPDPGRSKRPGGFFAACLRIVLGIIFYPRFLWRQLRTWFRDMWMVGLITLLGVVLMVPITVHTIPAGSVGVIWKRFDGGTDMHNLATEGTVVVFPWDRMFLYDARLQSGDNHVSGLSADGLKVEVDMAWAFYLVPAAASMVHKGIGPDYKDKVVVRVIESVVRDKVSLFRSEELHSPERVNFEKQVFAGIMTEIGRFEAINRLASNLQPASGESQEADKGVEWINLDAVLIKEIRFPPAVQEAYVRKNTARALVEEYNFRIIAEQKEVERKMVEALGIRNFQEVVQQGLSESYLRWKGIEASVVNTQALAQSPNAKLVVLGAGSGSGGSGNMPLILNTNALDGMEKAAGSEQVDRPPAPAAASPAAPKSQPPKPQPSAKAPPKPAAATSPRPALATPPPSDTEAPQPPAAEVPAAAPAAPASTAPSASASPPQSAPAKPAPTASIPSR